jgi:hypothetical protein
LTGTEKALTQRTQRKEEDAENYKEISSIGAR